jgi:hypothetical protein
VCKTRKKAVRAIGVIKAIMARLELTLHPTKSRLVGLWNGEEGFDFLGMHHRKTREETSTGKVYYSTKQWLTKKAERHIREVVKERLAPPSARVQSLEAHIEYLNPKIRGWRNYYATPHSKRKMAELDWYIIQRFTRWYAKKTKKRRSLSTWPKVKVMLCKQGQLKLA